MLSTTLLKTFIKHIFPISLLILLCACSHSSNIDNKLASSDTILSIIEQIPDVHLIKNDTLIYQGYINFTGYDLLKAQFEKAQAENKPLTLRIKSAGGYDLAAIKIAEFIREKHIHLIVDQYCLSACADYIFPAAVQKKMVKDAIVALHPSRQLSLNQDKVVTLEELLKEFDEAINNENYKVYFPIKKTDSSPSSTQPQNKHLQNSLKNFKNELTKYFPDYLAACRRLTFTNQVSREQALTMMKQNTLNCNQYKEQQKTRFYKNLGVNPDYPKLGLAKLKQIQQKQGKQIGFFFYDPRSIKKLGIDNVYFPNNWQPANNPKYKEMVEVTENDW